MASNQYTQLTKKLPNGMGWAELKAALANLPEAPTVDTAALVLHNPAPIIVGATGSGKTTALKVAGIAFNSHMPPVTNTGFYYGVLDDNGQATDEAIRDTIYEMLRYWRSHEATYKPVILLRNATWHRLERYFHYLDVNQYVSRFQFPASLYSKMLELSALPSWVITYYLTDTWREQLVDARGHFLPGVAWHATRELANGTSLTAAKAQALSVAGAHWVQHSPTARDFLPHMLSVVPENAGVRLRGEKLTITAARITQRLHTPMRETPLKNGWTKPQFLAAAQAEGIFKLGSRRNERVFAQPFASGYCTLKNKLLVIYKL